VSVFKLFAVGSVAVIAFLLFTIYAQPHVILEDKGEWAPFPEDMPPASRNLTCSITDCMYRTTPDGAIKLHFYIPRYVVKIVVYEPVFAYVILIAGVLSMVAVAYFASKIENMPTKKAIAVVAGLYGAGMTALMFMRKDFRAAAPILAPVAAALMVSAFILYLMLRASGHKVTLTVRKDSLQEQKIADAMNAVRKRKAAKQILKK
jgi:hypothetical protein